MRAKFWIVLLGCVLLCSACIWRRFPYIYVDAMYLKNQLPLVCDVSLFPFSYYTNQQGLYERLGEPMSGMVQAEVRRNLFARGLRVREQDLVNRLLLSRGVVRETTEEFALLPASAKYDLAYVGYSEHMKRLLRDYVVTDALTPEGARRPLTVQTEALSPKMVAEVGRELGADLVIRGRIASLGRPVVEPVDFEYSLIPRFIGNRDGVVVRAAYENEVEPTLLADLEFVDWKMPSRRKMVEHWALQIRLFAQETVEGRVVWSNTAVMSYSTLFDSELDQRAKAERLREAIAEEVEFLVSDLFRRPPLAWEGCAKKAARMEEREPVVEVVVPPREVEPKEERIISLPERIPEEALEELPPVVAREEEFVEVPPLEDVYFGYDRAVLSQNALQVLAQNAAWLRDHPEVEVMIEGHCDERGTIQYNLALGERRAASVRMYLVRLGIDPNRLFTISYGEERPFDPRHNEEAWAKNRRAHFLMTFEVE